MRILVVEDEALLAMWARDVLEGAGHTVSGVVQTRAGALALIETGEPDLLLMDINLPDGRGMGIELARYAWKRCVTPSLFLTGQVHEAKANRDAALGCLGKPCNESTLLASIEAADQLIGGRPPRAVPAGLELFRSAP